MARGMFTVLILNEFSRGEKRYLEESGILVNLEEDFFETRTPEEILTYFQRNIPEMEIETEEGEMVTQKVVRVLDSYLIKDHIKAEDFTEIWNIQIQVNKDNTLPDFLNDFYKGKLLEGGS